jgi:hypothetical protein
VNLAINFPKEGDLLIGQATGCTVNATGTALSPGHHVNSVTWRVGDNLYHGGANGSGNAPDPYSTWTASFTVPPGPWQIFFTGTDDASESATYAVDVQAAVPLDIFDFTPPSYLDALVESATQPVYPLFPASPGIVVGVGGSPPSIDMLEAAVAQRLRELQLPELAQKANEPVHQMRACIEVLRNYLQYRQWSGPFQMAEEARYRRAAYEALLLQLGTSAEELRLARSYGPGPADQDRRRALADRLGIDLGAARPDNLDLLVLDPSAPSSQANAVTEQRLERLFGLVDTTRDPLAR